MTVQEFHEQRREQIKAVLRNPEHKTLRQAAAALDTTPSNIIGIAERNPDVQAAMDELKARKAANRKKK